MTKAPFHFNQAQFMLSVASLHQLPSDSGAEIAFLGRSNVGKSSAINAITGISKLAKKSKTPGRTQLLNFFSLTDSHRLVDLPGYGFAKATAEAQAQWEKLMAGYLNTRQSLAGLVLLMDIRHPLTVLDTEVLSLLSQGDIPVYILLSKADKLKYGAQKNTLLGVQRALRESEVTADIQLFSSLKNIGIEEAREKITQLLLDF